MSAYWMAAAINVSHVRDAKRLSVLFFRPWGFLLGHKPLWNSIHICSPFFIFMLLIIRLFSYLVVCLSVQRKWYAWSHIINIHHISLFRQGYHENNGVCERVVTLPTKHQPPLSPISHVSKLQAHTYTHHTYSSMFILTLSAECCCISVRVCVCVCIGWGCCHEEIASSPGVVSDLVLLNELFSHVQTEQQLPAVRLLHKQSQRLIIPPSHVTKTQYISHLWNTSHLTGCCVSPI